MKSSLKSKLIFSYLAVALVTILIVILVTTLTSDQSLQEMVADQQIAQISDLVSDYYTAKGTLDGFALYYLRTSRLEDLPIPFDGSMHPMARYEMRGVSGLVDADHRAILPTFRFSIGEVVTDELLQEAVPVVVEKQTIAYILRDTKTSLELSPEEQRYVQRTNLAISLAALVGVGTAVALGIILAARLTKPILNLEEASARLARGALGDQVPVTSQDELGSLTQTFNQMSADLAKGDQERKRLTADITHDLSTPLQIISGYMEMLEGGEVQLTPDRIEIIKTEIEHLRRLVGDLTTLSQAEANGLDIQKSVVNPNRLLEHIAQAYQDIAERQGVRLEMQPSVQNCLVEVDEGRMLQILRNLVENALRYTPVGGRIVLSCRVKELVELQVSDTGSGIEAEDLPYVFERFYQADKARSANKGKMGLGLAICKALAEAQDCTVEAYSGGKDQGTTMTIRMAPFKGEQP